MMLFCLWSTLLMLLIVCLCCCHFWSFWCWSFWSCYHVGMVYIGYYFFAAAAPMLFDHHLSCWSFAHLWFAAINVLYCSYQHFGLLLHAGDYPYLPHFGSIPIWLGSFVAAATRSWDCFTFCFLLLLCGSSSSLSVSATLMTIWWWHIFLASIVMMHWCWYCYVPHPIGFIGLFIGLYLEV